MKKKGFTLVELIVVLGIITILTAIIIPSWGYYMGRSRVRDSAARAKSVFNAAQTVAIEYSSRERTVADADKYMGSGDFYFYYDGGTGTKLASDTGAADAGSDDAIVARKINNISGDDFAYKVYIKNYQVQSVIAARSENDRYIGAYPVLVDGIPSGAARVSNTKNADYDLS